MNELGITAKELERIAKRSGIDDKAYARLAAIHGEGTADLYDALCAELDKKGLQPDPNMPLDDMEKL